MFYLLYCFSSCLDFMIFMGAVDGALRADGSVACKTEISEFLLWVITARIHYLVSSFMFRCTSVAWLWDWSILGSWSLVILSWSLIALDFTCSKFSIVFTFILNIVIVPILCFFLIRHSSRLISISLLILHGIIQSLQFH